MVVVRNITFTSLCNHHVVPFMGVAHIAYVPKNAVAGLSKFARVVRHFGRQLQVQERLTAEIADFLEGTLSPRGVGVVVEAEHLCMTIRGVHSPGTLTTTSAMRGVFSDHDRTAKAEFLNLIRG
jgi:GTP cyclohydrolase I